MACFIEFFHGRPVNLVFALVGYLFFFVVSIWMYFDGCGYVIEDSWCGNMSLSEF